MSKHKRFVFLSLVLAITLVFGACAPGADQPVIVGGDATTAGQATPVAQDEPAVGDPAVTTPQTPGAFGIVGAEEGYMMLATALLGRNVVSMGDDNLGDVDDFLIDLSSGNIPFALISHGGFLGIGQNQAAVPLSAFSMDLEQNNLVLNMTQDQFDNFPNIELDNNWPVGMDAGWDADLRNFWTNAGFDVSMIDDATTGTVVRASQLIGYGFGAGAGVPPGGAVVPADPAVTTPITPTDGLTPTMPGSAVAPGVGMAGLGNTVDYIVDLGQGRVEYAVLSFADVATFGEEWAIVPFQAIESTPLGDQVMLDQGIDPNLLAGAPRIRGANLSATDFFAPGWDEGIRSYWSEQGYNLDQATGGTATGAVPAAQATPVTGTQTTTGTVGATGGFVGVTGAEQGYMILASALLGRNVESATGDNLGEVDDFLVDLTTGNVPFALVSHGGFLGIGQDQAPVPLSAFSVGPDQDNLVLNVTQDQLENFPNVDIDNNWPTGIGAGWDADLRNFWTNAGFDVGTIQGTEAGSVVRASQFVNTGFGLGTGTDTTVGQGDVEDYVVDLSEGRVRYALLSFADTATFGDEWVIVPFQAVGPSMQTGADGGFMFDQTLNNEILAGAPRVQGDMLADAEFFGPGWDEQVRTYWGDQGYQLD